MTKVARKIFTDIIADNRKGLAKGIYSICSANQEVLEACFMQAKADGSLLLVESTSHQVDQFGGYTGMKPKDFVDYVHTIAERTGFPSEMILLGGDHLGPNAWQDEAHSTDYQSESSLKALVQDHFCILKVGPWLTFAYREALFSLEAIESEIMGKNHPDLSKLSVTLEKVLVKEPRYWKSYYYGDENVKFFKRKYSFSDRSRYYWLNQEILEAKTRLYHNLTHNNIPLSLLSQFMPMQFYQIGEGKVSNNPKELVHSHIRTVAGMYARACGLTRNENN